MAIELINIGTFANDGTGDDLREAFEKVNRSLEDLDLRIGTNINGVNTGTGIGIFKDKNGFDLQFKSLVAGSNISLTDNTSFITVSTNDSIEDLPIISDSGSIVVEPQTTLRVNGGTGISTSVDTGNNSLIINYDGFTSLSDETAPSLTTSLDANSQNINNANEISAVNFIGHLTGSMSGTVNGVSATRFQTFFTNLDFGNFDQNLTSFIDYLVVAFDVDLGTINDPFDYNLDFGSF